MQAILSNAQHPEYGEVTIPFPIGENEYGRCLELLGKMEIGNPIGTALSRKSSTAPPSCSSWSDVT